MNLDHLQVTTVRPDSRATLGGILGQRPRERKESSLANPHDRPDSPNGAIPGVDAISQPLVVEERARSPLISLLNDEALERLEGPVGHDIDAWAELQAMNVADESVAGQPPLPQDVVQTTEGPGHDVDDTLIDPATAPRLYIRIRGEHREVWKPSDGDGDETTDWYGRTDLLPMHQRWRVFQTDIGPLSWSGGTIPPKYVYLDDDSAYQILNSDIPRAKICKFWPHDFGQPGKIRRFRAHIGRAAIKDDDAPGNEKYHSTRLGGRASAPYYFSGEPGYTEVRYRIPPKVEEPAVQDPAVAAREERKRKIDAILDAEPNRRKHGHNQYTPRDMLVKYGAPSGAKPVEKFHDLPPLPRPHHFVQSGQNPIFTEKRLVGGIAESARESVRDQARKAQEQALREASIESLRAALREREATTQASREDEDAVHPAQIAEQHLPSTASALTAWNSTSPPFIPIPHKLSFIERRDLERRIATETLQSLRNQDDVKALAAQLAVQQVKLGQQEKTIALLEKELRAKELEIERWEEVAQEREMQSEEMSG